MVYEPAEDSWLLKKAVREYATGRVLDMGTGSGIQASAASEQEKVTAVLAVDIDPQAVKQTKAAGIDAKQSDLFSNVDGLFDTIICNTPYLPDNQEAPDAALDGGPGGYEWTLRFLEQAKNHLAREGQILLLISTLSNPDVINPFLIKNGWVYEVVAEKKLFMESLLVYRITFALPTFPNATFLAKGKRGAVYKDNDRVIKKADTRRVLQEARMLKKVNALGIGPEYFTHTDEYVIMQYCDGPLIGEWVADAPLSKLTSVLAVVREQVRTLDAHNITKQEMTNPYKHVIITPEGPVLIDFERARYSERPQNETQFNEYIKRIARKRGVDESEFR